jgi:hypothetical protein
MALPVIGREEETGVLHDLVDGVAERGGVLVVRGDAGIGKSTLLAAAARRALHRGMVCLTASGVQSEAHLPFAGLHQLLHTFLGRRNELPPRQRAALEAAFGMTDAAPPDLLLIALATLDLLSDAAARTPLLLIAEDAQWLDRPTTAVLAFLARRLEVDPIVLLIALHDGTDDPFEAATLPVLRVEPLDEEAAAALLDRNIQDLTPAVRARLLREAAGNPLALVELPVAQGSVISMITPARYIPMGLFCAALIAGISVAYMTPEPERADEADDRGHGVHRLAPPSPDDWSGWMLDTSTRFPDEPSWSSVPHVMAPDTHGVRTRSDSIIDVRCEWAATAPVWPDHLWNDVPRIAAQESDR